MKPVLNNTAIAITITFASAAIAMSALVHAQTYPTKPLRVISNSASPSSFSISGAGGVVAGAFLCTVSSGTSGVLFSEADFQSPGDRTVGSGDTLNVTYTFSLDAA